MTSKHLGLISGLMAAILVTAPAVGQEIKQLGTFNFWTAWSGTDANGLMCYISAQPESWEPQSIDGSPVRRSPIHFLVINRKGLGTRNEVQTMVGYPFSESSPSATATVDGKTYNMVTEGEAAWLAVEADEPGFVDALKAGSKLVVKGRSARGNMMTDNYSLSGVTAAINEIQKACT